MGLFCGLLGLVVPIVIAVTIDDAIPRADRRQLGLLCAFLVAVALAVASFQAIQTVALARLRGKLESSLLPAFWDRLLEPAGSILRPVRGGRPCDPGPGAGPVDRRAGRARPWHRCWRASSRSSTWPPCLS